MLYYVRTGLCLGTVQYCSTQCTVALQYITYTHIRYSLECLGQ